MDHLASITYPSGRTVDYTRSALGEVATVDSTYAASTITVADDAAYLPFGPLATLTFGNSLVLERTFDQQYRLSAQTTGAIQELSFTLDAAGNVDAIDDGVTASLDQTFTQDPLHRIDSDAGAYGSNAYSYDENGNRLTRVHTSGGVTTQTLTYASDSNRLATHDGQTVSLDAAGNSTADPAESLSFVYDDHNRMVEAYVGATLKASYVYNAQGQRVKKVESTGAQRTIVYHYGLSGEMLGETIYSSGGAKIGERDYLWLDSLPLAQSERTFSGGTVTSSQFVYLHADQLNTPRLATNATGTVVWRWDSDAFGVGAANTDPDADTNLVNIRLRFPGQYLDEETGLSYNYFRDYDSVTGRYMQPDPIGLAAGTDTYGYVGANPITSFDPFGLDAIDVNYDYYPVNTGLGFHLPLGHAGVVSVNPVTGETRYYEFGRYEDKECGNVKRRKVPNVKIGPNGLPTQESLDALYAFLSKHFGKDSDVTATYYANTDYKATNDYAERFSRKHDCYSLFGNNCKSFAHDAATAGDEAQPGK